jgi:hypothetical protein
MLRLKSYIGLQTAEFCACVGSAGMLHARWFAGPRQCLSGGVPSASKIVLDQTDGCASVALVCCKVCAPPAAKGRIYFSTRINSAKRVGFCCVAYWKWNRRTRFDEGEVFGGRYIACLSAVQGGARGLACIVVLRTIVCYVRGS